MDIHLSESATCCWSKKSERSEGCRCRIVPFWQPLRKQTENTRWNLSLIACGSLINHFLSITLSVCQIPMAEKGTPAFLHCSGLLSLHAEWIERRLTARKTLTVWGIVFNHMKTIYTWITLREESRKESSFKMYIKVSRKRLSRVLWLKAEMLLQWCNLVQLPSTVSCAWPNEFRIQSFISG